MKTAPTKQPTRTRRVFALSAALALMAWGTVGAKADDVLFNGTLDAIGPNGQDLPGPLGWVVEAYRSISNPAGGYTDGGSSETFCNVSPPSDPAGYGFFFKPFHGTWGPPGLDDLMTVYLYQDNAATPNTSFTLSFNAAGEANFCAFFPTNTPAPGAFGEIIFLDNANNVIVSNAFDLVATFNLPNGGPGAMAGYTFTSPTVIAPAGTVTVRAGAYMFNAYSTSGGQSFFVDNLALNAVAPAGSPVVTNQPTAVTVAPGGTASFTVGVSNSAGVSYQWQLYNTNLVNGGGISGATSQTVTITGASAANVGHYRVKVSNAVGSSYSVSVPLAVQSLSFFPVVVLTGKSGDTYRVDYATTLTPTPDWTPLSTNRLTSATQLIIDTGSPGANKRFYRSVFLH
jgi:hypothetical protein